MDSTLIQEFKNHTGLPRMRSTYTIFAVKIN